MSNPRRIVYLAAMAVFAVAGTSFAEQPQPATATTTAPVQMSMVPVSVDGPCRADLDCAQGSACLAGQCTPGRRFRRFEVFADGIPFSMGYWTLRHDQAPDNELIMGRQLTLQGGIGLGIRGSWSVHPRWAFGGYLGYAQFSDGFVYVYDIRRDIGVRALRTGAQGSYRWPAHRLFASGLGLELGLLLGTSDRRDVGIEVGPDLFFDIPLMSGPTRPFLTLSFGFRAGIMDQFFNLPEYGDTVAVWFYVMPVIRVGLGYGR